jgi:hypothetical protein
MSRQLSKTSITDDEASDEDLLNEESEDISDLDSYKASRWIDESELGDDMNDDAENIEIDEAIMSPAANIVRFLV